MTSKDISLKSHIVVLGSVYKDTSSSSSSSSSSGGGRGGNKKEYIRHVRSLFRFTYRRDFLAFDPYGITSDAGWGCMLRVSQMMMATACQRHMLGRDWRRGSGTPAGGASTSTELETLRANNDYCNILRWFMDYPGPPHIYAIHHMVQCGIKYDKLPGEWFGPSTAALVLRDLAKLHRAKYNGTLEILIAEGDTIYISEAENVCCGSAASSSSSSSRSASHPGPTSTRIPAPAPTSPEDGDSSQMHAGESADISKCAHLHKDADTGAMSPLYDPLLNPPPISLPPWSCSLVVCVPLRLGISSVNKEYVQELQMALRNPFCLGFIGGRENHAIFFVGYRQQCRTAKGSGVADPAGDTTTSCSFLGLDPHTVFPTASVHENFPSKDLISQVHVDDLDSLDSSRLDPSLALAFYFRDREEFQRFCEETRAAETERKKTNAKTVSPLYTVQHAPPQYDDIAMFDDGQRGEDEDEDDESLSVGAGAPKNSEGDSDDEYVLV